jgi:hypothetical protein
MLEEPTFAVTGREAIERRLDQLWTRYDSLLTQQEAAVREYDELARAIGIVTSEIRSLESRLGSILPAQDPA